MKVSAAFFCSADLGVSVSRGVRRAQLKRGRESEPGSPEKLAILDDQLQARRQRLLCGIWLGCIHEIIR